MLVWGYKLKLTNWKSSFRSKIKVVSEVRESDPKFGQRGFYNKNSTRNQKSCFLMINTSSTITDPHFKTIKPVWKKFIPGAN